MVNTANKRTVHIGRNIKYIRRILDIKQDALAQQLGLSQQTISQLEQKETLDTITVDKVARALGITPDAICNFNKEATCNSISDNYHVRSSPVSNMLPIGKKIEGVRRLSGITQTILGNSLGITKQAVSKIERTKQIDNERLNCIARALGVTANVIKNFSEEATLNIMADRCHDHSSSVNYPRKPLEKILRLYDEKIALLERVLKEKNDLIENLKQQQSK